MILMKRNIIWFRTTVAMLFVLLFGVFNTPVYSQTFFGMNSNPVDNTAQGGNVTLAIVPPGSMAQGDLVIVYAQYRSNANSNFTIQNAGGQTWNVGTTATGSTLSCRIYWCRFNGTWSANPQISGGNNGGIAFSLSMYVFRPNGGSNSSWDVHTAQANTTPTPSGGGNTTTIATGSYTTLVPRTVTMGFWGQGAASTWGTLSGTNWSKASYTAAQYRNTTGSSQTHTSAYNIQTASGTTIDPVSQNSSSNLAALCSYMTWFEVTNNDCSGAVSFTPGAAGAGCTGAIPGSMNNATQSGGVPAGCASGTLYDVWYSFTAASNQHNIQVSTAAPAALSANYTNRQVEIYQGTCAGLSFVTCSAATSGNINFSFSDFTPSVTYYVRVLSPNAAIATAGRFNFCITTTAMSGTLPPVFTGKSYTNISRPTGGIIANGDILEFRYNITIGDWAGSQPAIYNARFLDTIPSGVSYVANSIRFETNEGFTVPSAITNTAGLTDASGDDEAVYSGGIMRVNVGTLNRQGSGSATTRQFTTNIAAATTPITDLPAGGGKMSKYGRPNQFGGFVVLVVRYQVQVTAATSSIFQTSYGKFMYQTGTADVAAAQTTVNFPRYAVYVSENASLCQSSVGINVYGNGNFGTGTTRHDSTQLTIAPGYTWSPFNTGSPGDGLFAVVNNTSANGSTNKYVPVTDAVNRVFSVWDIIGDHTNAANQDSGNFAVPPGTNGGYMAVVNAAYGINTAVQRTITGLCSDTYYEFSAWFKNICQACSSDSAGYTYGSGASFKSYIPVKTLNDSAGVSPDLTYTIDGVDYYTTGGIPYDRRWIKKGFLFKTGPAQTSVTLTIRNNAPGGGGNDWAIDDIGLATCLPSLTMRPNNNPTYCNFGQVTLSVAVSTFYNNYVYYFWERSTDNGASWTAIHGDATTPLTYTYSNFAGGEYRDTVALPTFIASPAMSGYRYRIRTATSTANLSSSTCAVYNSVDVITLNVDPGCFPLQVDLFAFNVQLKNGYSQLTWSAKQEDNLKYYEVEKSYDGINFTNIGKVDVKYAGAQGSSYLFNDPTAVSGKVYYRLKLIRSDAEGNKFSNILSVSLNGSDKLEIVNLVNPFSSRVTFQLNAFRNEEVQLQLTDVTGHQLLSKKYQVVKGSNAVAFEVPQQLAKGSYLLRIVSASGNIHRIIQKQ
jgi:trimeric autotransporter adhesin